MLKPISFKRLFLLLALLTTAGFSTAHQKKSVNPVPYQIQNQKETRVYYSVFVQSFYDSNNDGIGDIKGLISKLDYLKDLGVGGLWLLPVHPSPTYHKYDVVDYMGIHKDYGTLEDYKELVRKAHEMDILVVLDLVANHTSNRHPWFEKAASGNKKFQNYYVWSSDNEMVESNKYQWHQKRDDKGKVQEGEKYYGLFWWEMPDLNYDEPKVREEMINVGRFWLKDIGVDGFRLDAAEHIYPPDQLDKTIGWWKEFKNNMIQINPNVIIFGEVWGGSEKTAPYLESGFSAGFNFELSDTIRKSIKAGHDLGIIQTIEKIIAEYSKYNPDFEDATILTNHDMERIMTELGRNVDQAKLGATLLLTLPGNPFIYYGEEIGMLGEKPDEYIREPFLWNIEGKDPGQTRWEIPYASSSNTVKPLFYQLDDRTSIFNNYKSLINLRNHNPALNKGSISNIDSHNPRVVSFYRHSQEQEAIVIINLSSELERITTFRGFDGFEIAYSNFNVFKVNDKEISLQPHSFFILTRASQIIE